MSSDIIDAIYKDPKLWGPHYWFIMKCIAHNYPNKPDKTDKAITGTFFSEQLPYFLPCNTCKKHYTEILGKYPVKEKLCCNECLIKWVEKIQAKIEDIKNNRYTETHDDRHDDRGLRNGRSKSRGKSVKSRGVSKSKTRDNSRSKSRRTVAIYHPDNKFDRNIQRSKSKFNVNHDVGNDKYFKPTQEYYKFDNQDHTKEVQKAAKNTWAMNNRSNNINAAKNTIKFNNHKAITFARKKKR